MAKDIFFINRTVFLIMVSWRIKFVTAEHLQVRTASNLSKQLKHVLHVLQVYGYARFFVTTILMDREFEKVKQSLPTVEYSTTAAKQHMSEAKRIIRTIMSKY